MSESTTAVANTASKKAAQAAAAVSEALPTVVETAEIALEVPSKVVLNQKLVVAASVAGGMALGAGIYYGVQKFRVHRLVNKLKSVDENTNDETAEA